MPDPPLETKELPDLVRPRRPLPGRPMLHATPCFVDSAGTRPLRKNGEKSPYSAEKTFERCVGQRAWHKATDSATQHSARRSTSLQLSKIVPSRALPAEVGSAARDACLTRRTIQAG
jgi:hypothetical protein